MNISFVTKSGSSGHRHMLEHLMLYRSEKYPEAASFYNYLYRNNVIIDFKTIYGYMEISFYNVSSDIILEIENNFKNFYFTEADFDLEKRVILIESANHDYEKVNLEKPLLLKSYEDSCDFNLLNNITYLDILKIKQEYLFERYIYSDVLHIKNYDTSCKNTFIKISENTDGKNSSFHFHHNVLLFELIDILHKCLFLSGSEIKISRIFTLDENTVIFYGATKQDLLEGLESIFMNNFENAYELFLKEELPNGVQFTLKNYANIKYILSKDDTRLAIVEIIKEVCK